MRQPGAVPARTLTILPAFRPDFFGRDSAQNKNFSKQPHAQ